MVGGWSGCALACVALCLLLCTVESAVTCWGRNNTGQLAVPQGLGPVVQLAAGVNHTCARTADGTLSCWGLNNAGQSVVPPTLGNVTGVSAGLYHTCASTSGGAVSCWGRNNYGQCRVPSGLAPVAELAAGWFHTCARATSGAVTCWGNNIGGQCNVPNDLGSAAELVAGGWHTCARATSGAVRCWGSDSDGRCKVPSGLGTVVQLVAGGGHTCALASSGIVTCWGWNGYGQCTVPESLDPFEELAAGRMHTCARLASGAIRCWGKNTYGQSSVPAGLGHVAELAAGYHHTCAHTTTLTEWLDEFSSAAERVWVNISHDGHGVISLVAQGLPAVGMLHGGASLAYSADLQPTAAALTWNSSCSSLWHLTGRGWLEASLPKESLRSGPCQVNEELREGFKVYSGYVGLFARITSDGDRVLKEVYIAVEFWLSQHTQAIQPVSVRPRTTVVMQPPVHLASFPSSLQLFEAGFARALTTPALTAGETVSVQQSVEAAGPVELSLVSVWLSASPDPANTAAARMNLSAAPTLLPAPASAIRFSVSMQACLGCYIHVISAMRDKRGAGVQASSQVQSTATPTDELQGSFKRELHGEPSRAGFRGGSGEGAGGVLPSTAHVNVGLTPVATEHGVSRVRVAYTIAVPITGLPNGHSG